MFPKSCFARCRPTPSWWLLLLAIPVLLENASAAIRQWHLVFDDAFITYRYSANLAMGHGITWNPGQPPTEGYTNFLLVLLVAPAIRCGLDPLLFVRALSFLAVIATGVLLFVVARRRFGSSLTTTLMISSLLLLTPATSAICASGMETSLYSMFLLAAFLAGVQALETPTLSSSLTFVSLLFLTVLLRPEATLLYPIFLIAAAPSAIRERTKRPPLFAGLASLLVLGGAYLAWKQAHFGALLPNSFFLKANRAEVISPAGLHSVTSFFREYAALLALSVSSLAIVARGDRPEDRWRLAATRIGIAFSAAYCAIFLHIDTMMDFHGRFLYPLAPIAIVLAMPTLSRGLGFLESLADGSRLARPLMIGAFTLAFGMPCVLGWRENLEALSSGRPGVDGELLMQKERTIGRALAAFPEIESVRVAFADSGTIPYFSGAIWLDVAGLNDRFIATTSESAALVDYFFDWSADLVIHPGKAKRSWLESGHGPLGDYRSWSRDPRFDRYAYVGSIRVKDSSYDLQLFVLRTGRFRQTLEEFLKTKVVDGHYEPFPLPIGTYTPNGVESRWLPRVAVE